MVDNKVAVLILQHPQEQDRVLGTAKLICATVRPELLPIGATNRPIDWRTPMVIMSIAVAASTSGQ